MSEQELKFQNGDRVTRTCVDGPVGTVKSVRLETTRTSIRTDDGEPPGITVTVLWDNGTLSHLVPNGLAKVDA